MKITILGSGAAGGVPMISVGWGQCDPANPRNRRRRPSILVEEAGKTILVDTSPDLREQLLGAGIRHLDAVLYTHAHADHLHGIDDLREVNRAMGAAIDVYGSDETLKDIQERFGYVFTPLDPKTMPIYKPWLVAHVLNGPVEVGPVRISHFDQDHGYCRTTGYRFGKVAYSTDVVNLPDASLQALEGIETWIVGCLMEKPHPTHAHVGKIIEWAQHLRPKRTILTHMSPRMDFAHLVEILPPGMEPGYDGMVIEA